MIDVTDRRNTPRSLAIIMASLVVFAAGCAVAIYRDDQNDMEKELGSDSRMAVSRIISVYGGISGALSIRDLEADPGRVSGMEPFKGRVAMVRLNIPDGAEITVKLPDEKTFDNDPRIRENTQSEVIPVETDPGRVVPGKLEVTVFG
jgi:hypothetical protein